MSKEAYTIVGSYMRIYHFFAESATSVFRLIGKVES